MRSNFLATATIIAVVSAEALATGFSVFEGIAPSESRISTSQFQTYSTAFGIRIGYTNSTDLLEKLGPATPVVENSFGHHWRDTDGPRRSVTYCYKSADGSFVAEFDKQPNATTFSFLTITREPSLNTMGKCAESKLTREQFPLPIWLDDKKDEIESKIKVAKAFANAQFTTWSLKDENDSEVVQALHPNGKVSTLRLIVIRKESGKVRDYSRSSHGGLSNHSAIRIVFGGKSETYSGQIDRDKLKAALNGKLDKFRKCYSTALELNPDDLGEAHFKWTIEQNGRGTDFVAEHSTLSNRLTKCALSVLKEMKFPTPNEGKPIKVSYPIIFAN